MPTNKCSLYCTQRNGRDSKSSFLLSFPSSLFWEPGFPNSPGFRENEIPPIRSPPQGDLPQVASFFADELRCGARLIFRAFNLDRLASPVFAFAPSSHSPTTLLPKVASDYGKYFLASSHGTNSRNVSPAHRLTGPQKCNLALSHKKAPSGAAF